MGSLTMLQAFKDCQFGYNCHAKHIESLYKIYDSTTLDEFWDDFIQKVKHSLIVYQREPAVERTLNFVAKFATSVGRKQQAQCSEPQEAQEEVDEEEEEMHPLLLRFFNFLLKHHNARDKGVRFRCCQMINKLLVNMGEGAPIDDDLCDKIYECMLQRLRDKFPAVREQAVLALTLLQDPTDAECPIISAYQLLMTCDPSVDVRRAVLSSTVASAKTLPAILERTRDTSEVVRKLAYKVIADKIHIKALTIAQRVHVLNQGLNDRSEAVREACATGLLQKWLLFFEGCALDLLRCLDVENSLETSQLTLKALFKKSAIDELVANFDLLNDSLVIPWGKLTCESALYWRALGEHTRSLGNQADEHMDRIVPTLSYFCGYLQGILEEMEKEERLVEQEKGLAAPEESLVVQLKNDFMVQQLLGLAHHFDMADEAGRKRLRQCLIGMLTNDSVRHSLVESVMALFMGLGDAPDVFVNELAETISDIRQPIRVVEAARNTEELRQLNLKLAKVTVTINEAREELQQCIADQDYGRAAEIKEKVEGLETSKLSLVDETLPVSQETREERSDPATWLKCLTIACKMLASPKLRSLTPTLQTLMETLVLPGIQNADPAVRNVATNCLGLCCLLNQDTARAHLLLFMQIAYMDLEVVQVTAIMAIFDLLHFFGLETFQVSGNLDQEKYQQDALDGVEDVAEEKEDEDEEGEGEETGADLSTDTPLKKVATPEKPPLNTARSVMTILLSFLDSESCEVRTVCAQGLAKLLLSARVLSPRLVSRLLLLWYNPVTGDDARLRHCLGAFFPIYAFSERVNQSVMEEAVLPTLQTLFDAPISSPLAEVDVINVAELLVGLCDPRHLVNKDPLPGDVEDVNPHDNLAMKMANAILNEPTSFHVRSLCRVLNMLDLSPDNEMGLKDLKVLTERMLKEVKNKECSRMLGKFQRTVSDLLRRSASHGSLGAHSSEEGAVGSSGDAPGQGRDLLESAATLQSDNGSQEDDEEHGPSTSRQTRAASTRSAASRPRRGRAAANGVAAEEGGESSEGDTSVFTSPTPQRSSRRLRQTRTATVTSAKAPKVNLDELLAESETQSEPESPDKDKSCSTRASSQRRPPLTYIENEAS